MWFIEGLIGAVVSLAMIGVAYYLPRKITGENIKYHTLETRFDERIPFVSVFVIAYFAAYLSIVIVPFIVSYAFGADYLIKYLICLGIFSLVSFIIYVIFPTNCPRNKQAKNLKHGTIFDRGVAIVYKHDDPPIGCLPSFHNGTAWLPFAFYIFSFSDFNVAVALSLGVFAILVSLSTLFIRQHFIIDMLMSAALVFSIAYLILTL